MNTERFYQSTWLGLLVNLAYAAVHAVLGILTQSWWLITLGAYSVVLGVMRLANMLIHRKAKGNWDEEHFARRFTGGMFLAMALCLVGTVILSYTDERGIVYHEIIMITMALYAFVRLTLGIVHLVQSKKHPSPVIKTLRNIAFADALVSIFSLQRSMLVSFGEMTPENIRLFNLLTGSGVCILVFLLGINLIGGKKIDMAKSKLVQANEKIASAVVGGYKTVERTVVGAYTSIEDKFVDTYLTRDGETVEEAKARLKKQTK